MRKFPDTFSVGMSVVPALAVELFFFLFGDMEIEVEVARRFIQMRIDQRPNGLVLLEVIRAMEIEHATERRAQRRYRVQSAQRSN